MVLLSWPGFPHWRSRKEEEADSRDLTRKWSGCDIESIRSHER